MRILLTFIYLSQLYNNKMMSDDESRVYVTEHRRFEDRLSLSAEKALLNSSAFTTSDYRQITFIYDQHSISTSN
jgi:hypothetical protein